MAIIREVRVHENSRQWAYIEYSDEKTDYLRLVGDKQFATKEEAIEYSKGFELFSYTWVEPIEIKAKRLIEKKKSLLKELEKINTEEELLIQEALNKILK